jgi:hypothetical protein
MVCLRKQSDHAGRESLRRGGARSNLAPLIFQGFKSLPPVHSALPTARPFTDPEIASHHGNQSLAKHSHRMLIARYTDLFSDPVAVQLKTMIRDYFPDARGPASD